MSDLITNRPNSDQSTKVKSFLNVKNFYGVQSCSVEKSGKSLCNQSCNIKDLPRRLNHLFGPTQVWKIFQKQSEALEFAKLKRSGLMTFAFQKCDGVRSFLVAHPQIFWHYDVQKSTSIRHSFEVIPDLSACKLYFDLEFNILCNPNKRGPEVVDVFINLVLHFLHKLFNVKASRENILDLDSSTDEKFSRHLIFQLSPYVFCNNSTVGEFVILICQKLQLYLDFVEKETKECTKNDNQQPIRLKCDCCQLACVKDIGCIECTGISVEKLKTLEVVDRKGKKSLICDTSVYSKNRHFRLFQNTKWGKNVPLLLSDSNNYIPIKTSKCDDVVCETYFLDSLVSHVNNHTHTKIIQFENNFQSKVLSKKNLCPPSSKAESTIKSPFSEVDNFINALVSPGHIRKCAYFCSSSVIVYDIVGNRYCQNIKRQHQSNNVKYIVSLETYTFYQKCYDPDCSSFSSIKLPLPPELKFKLDNDTAISDSDLMEIISAAEDLESSLEDFQKDQLSTLK